jgi:hypothetical protein
MTPKPRHLRAHGNKRQYHIPKERYQKQRLEDAHTILRQEKVIAELRDMIEYLEFRLAEAEK